MGSMVPDKRLNIKELEIGIFNSAKEDIQPIWRKFAGAMEESRFKLK